MRSISIRFDPDDKEAIERAAKLEGLNFSAYVRRAAVAYTREHHPETFAKRAD
jgi:uncharacterized protein (DUF1778 family)